MTEIHHENVQDRLTERIIGAAIEVHRHFGPGLLEKVYEEALVHELALRGVQTEVQVPVAIRYKGCSITGQRIDLIVDKFVVVEVKAVERMKDIFVSQTLTYLRASGLTRGLVINFGQERLKDGLRRVAI
ncbi:MAG: GxxExxY protein [Acidobacteriota bacterium]|nr:GxxExxY protein [Acidobacteriota bacterium]